MGCWRISLFNELTSYAYSRVMSGIYSWVELGAVVTFVVLEVFHKAQVNTIRKNFSESTTLLDRWVSNA